ncbi:MAG: hypothetical protein KF868_00925 [Acidobacteria bacterium]|nr:hypothetical protein [Acidobacteriota bacterium]
MANTTYNAPPAVSGWQQRALVVGVIGLIATLAGYFVDHDQFYRAWLVGFIFVLGITLGSLGFLMIQYLTGGSWGVATRRIFEASARTIFPIVALLFIPVVVGMHSLYHWTHLEDVAKDPILQQKEPYLNVTFFLIRAVFYFAVWALLASFLAKWAKQHDDTGNHSFRQRLADLSGPGVLIYGLTMSFAAFDWVMSLDPHWFSTIYGLLVIAGQGISSIAFTIVIATRLWHREPMNHVYNSGHFHDLGKLLFALIMLWAYFSYSQLVIIWSGNLPEEIPWYLRRFSNEWKPLSWALLVFHFILPFSILLSRGLKRNARKLVIVAGLLLVMRVLDIVWLVAPEFKQTDVGGLWMYATAPIGIGGIWLWFFFRNLQSRELLPVKDPQFEQALVAASHH